MSASPSRQHFRNPRHSIQSDLRSNSVQQKYGSSSMTSVSLVAETEAMFSLGRAIYFDGFSFIGCENDVSPAAQRIYFKDHACGPDLKSCRLTELGMQPRLCFDFCRAQPSARFFGIELGRDCYCTGYFTERSTGGGGCDLPCEGDSEQACGGNTKSTMFEMHMCGDSSAEAEAASVLADDAATASSEFLTEAVTTITKLQALVDVWRFSVCSVQPEGERVCALPSTWLQKAAAVQAAVAEVEHSASTMDSRSAELGDALQAFEEAGDKVSAAQASKVELATGSLRDAAAKMLGCRTQGCSKGLRRGSTTALHDLTGPFDGGEAMDEFANVFSVLGDVEGGWSSVCALEAIDGQSYAAVTTDEPSVCGSHCLGLSTGVDACVAFNYQYKDGLAACQFLKAKGITSPKTSMLKGVPIFEVSDTKRDAMEIASMGCYAHGAFLAGHPQGPLKADVIREVTIDA